MSAASSGPPQTDEEFVIALMDYRIHDEAEVTARKLPNAMPEATHGSARHAKSQSGSIDTTLSDLSPTSGVHDQVASHLHSMHTTLPTLVFMRQLAC